MEELCIRFSHLTEKMFDLLDNESMINCKEASRFWCNYLDGQKIVQIRIIKAKVEQFHSIGDSWTKAFNSATTKTIMTLGTVVNQFYKRDMGLKYFEGLTPMHAATATGELLLYKKLKDKSLDKHPKDNEGCTPLYYAAQNGHLEICEHIIQRIEDKNPACNIGKTPLHAAAADGRFKVCEFILKHVRNKNPKDNEGYTPLHQAAKYGQGEICDLLREHLEDKNPANKYGMTPLHC